MNSGPADLEYQLASWVVQTLRAGDAPCTDSTQVIAAIHSVLEERFLHDEEAPLASRGDGSVEARDLHRAVEERLRRALAAGLDSARVSAADTVVPAPRVVVLDPTLPLTQVPDTVARELETLARTVPMDSRAPQPRLVLVGESSQTGTSETATYTGPESDQVDIVTVRELAPLAQALRALLMQAAPTRPGLAWRQDADAMVGHLFHDKYRIEKCLGEGGFGRVYKATEEVVGYPVAIKLLKPQFRQESRHVQEFMEEARRLFSLEHENIGGWKVFDRTPAGDWYFVMEFLQGQDLEAVLEREKRLDHRRVGQILVQTLRALEKAHFLSETEGILHLDLKPKNVFLVTGAGRYHEKVKVIDFGVGQLVRRRSATAEAGSPPVRGEAASASGTQQITGLTIDYASPEQLAYLLPEGARVPLDARSDLFSLGVMGFRMLTGEFPFDTKPPPPSEAAGFEKQAHTRKARMRMQVPCRTLDSTDVRVPRRLAAFLDRCLKLNRDERFPDSRAALAELEAIVDPPLLKRALGLAGVGALVAVVAAVVITRWLLPPTSHEFALLQNELELGADHPLFLGPAGATQVLGVDRGVLLDPALPLVLVESSLGGDLLPGWSVALVADGRLRITAPEDAVTGSRLVHVRQGELRSRNLRIVFLDPASWSVPTIQIDGWDSSRTIAPEGVVIHMPIQFSSKQVSADVLDRAELSWRGSAGDGGPLPITTIKGRAHGYEAPMAILDLRDGECEFSARVFDRAGNVHEPPPLSVRIARGPLDFSGTLSGTRVGGAVQILSSSTPVLHVAVNRTAKVTWSAKDASGANVGASGSRTVESRATIELPELVRGRDHSYSGELSVWADDAASVFRRERPDLGLARPPPLLFTVNLGTIQVTPTLYGGTAGRRRRLDPQGSVIFTSEPELQMELARQNMLPVTVRFSCFEETVRGPVLIGEERVLVEGRSALSSAVPIPVQLPHDGAYRLHAAVLLHDSVEDADVEESLVPFDVNVVLDRSTPGFALEADFAPGAVLSDPAALGGRAARGRGSDAPIHGVPQPPLASKWTCRRILDSESSTGDLSLPQGEPVAIPLEAPGGRWLDGQYELRLLGADAAGNRNEVGAILAWELAATGPEVAFRWDVPSPETTEWTRDEEGWRIRAASFDSNGVAAVRCTIAALDDPSMKAERELELDPATGNWKSAFTFSSEWSGKRVSLLLEARDNRGNPGRSAEQQRPLASIAAKRFPVAKVVPVASGGGPAPESMRLVRGNASEDGPYLFRGQPDAVENRGFTRDGISTPFSTGRLRAMSIEYRPGDIEDFYLDAHEVSIGQYLAFVQASDGYGAPECWPSRSPGSADRRVELTTRLEAALQAGQTDVPVTGVDLLEASAYAAWVSKRLPSVVEFEYAVRGGTRHYRSWSGARNGLLLSGNVYFNAGAGGRPGKREFGGDVTPEGIWCLSGNVAEWTATPTYFDEATALDKLYQFTHFRIESLRPWESPKSSVAGQFYAGGGCFDSRSADFFRIEELAVGERRANVGFRCALSGGEAEARAREADPGRFRLEFAEQ